MGIWNPQSELHKGRTSCLFGSLLYPQQFGIVRNVRHTLNKYVKNQQTHSLYDRVKSLLFPDHLFSTIK